MDDRRPDLAKRFALAAHSNAVLPILLVLEILETTIVPFPYEAIFVALYFLKNSKLGQEALVICIVARNKFNCARRRKFAPRLPQCILESADCLSFGPGIKPDQC